MWRIEVVKNCMIKIYSTIGTTSNKIFINMSTSFFKKHVYKAKSYKNYNISSLLAPSDWLKHYLIHWIFVKFENSFFLANGKIQQFILLFEKNYFFSKKLVMLIEISVLFGPVGDVDCRLYVMNVRSFHKINSNIHNKKKNMGFYK